MIRWTLVIAACVASAQPAAADLVISQFYRGSSSIAVELFNAGNGDLSLDSFYLGVWESPSFEGYKFGTQPTSSTELPSITLASGGVFVATTNNFLLGDLDFETSVLNNAGNSSVAIYQPTTGGDYSTAGLVDAFGQLGDLSAPSQLVRQSLEAGFDLAAGSNASDFSTVWQEATVAEVNVATIGGDDIDERLGYTTLAVAAVPEPTAPLVGMLIATGLTMTAGRRPNRRCRSLCV